MYRTFMIFSNPESLRQEEAMFWSSKDGWVDFGSADLFTTMDVGVLDLPLEGAWLPQDYAECVRRYWQEITQSEQKITVEYLWERLGDVPVTVYGVTEEAFLGFPAGTNREDIWFWFEEFFDISIADYMGGIK